VKAATSGFKVSELSQIYLDDLERLKEVLGSTSLEALSKVTPDNYKIRLYHFQKAAELLELEIDRELMDIQESMISREPGTALGLATDPQGRRGLLLIVECMVRKGQGKVNVTGVAKTLALTPGTPIEDVSVVESAQNAVDYIKLYVQDKLGMDIADYDFRFQVVSPLEGVPGTGVSGPSLGLALSVAALSELIGCPSDPSVVMTGKVDIKGRVGPVGGLDWRGAGKIIAAIKTRRVKIKKFIMPKWNYERSRDEVKVLEDSGITVVPVEKQVEAWVHSLNMDESVILEKLAINLKRVDAFADRQPSYLRKPSLDHQLESQLNT